MIQMNLFIKQKQTHRLENKLMLLGGRMGGRASLGVWNGHVPTALFKMNNVMLTSILEKENWVKKGVMTSIDNSHRVLGGVGKEREKWSRKADEKIYSQ